MERAQYCCLIHVTCCVEKKLKPLPGCFLHKQEAQYSVVPLWRYRIHFIQTSVLLFDAVSNIVISLNTFLYISRREFVVIELYFVFTRSVHEFLFYILYIRGYILV